MIVYKHRIVQGLADLIEKYGGGGRDPLMKAVWFGIKGQVPTFLKSLDENEEVVAEIRRKLLEVLDIKPEIVEVSPKPEPVPVEEIKEVVKTPPKRKRKKNKSKAAIKGASAKITLEPLEE